MQHLKALCTYDFGVWLRFITRGRSLTGVQALTEHSLRGSHRVFTPQDAVINVNWRTGETNEQ